MTNLRSRVIEIPTWKDLILMTVQMPTPIIHKLKRGKGFIYFTYFQMVPSRALVIYCLKTGEEVTKRFVSYDRLNDTIRFSDKLSTEPHLAYIPIISVKKENVLPSEI
ncbi:MAG: hypothetical protein ACE5OY_07590 [Candidatus Bathyarchaeia archaeon]